MKTPTEEITHDAYRSSASADFGRASYYCRVGALVSLCVVATFCAFCWRSVETFGQRARQIMTRERLAQGQLDDRTLAADADALSATEDLYDRLDALYPTDLKFGWQTQTPENTPDTLAQQPAASRATLGDYQTDSFDNAPLPPENSLADAEPLSDSDALATLESNLTDALNAQTELTSALDESTSYGDEQLVSSVSNDEYVVGYNDAINIETEQVAGLEGDPDDVGDLLSSVPSTDSLVSDDLVGVQDDPLDLNRLAQEFEDSQAGLAELTPSLPETDVTVGALDNALGAEELASSATLVAAAPVQTDAFDDTPAPQVSSRARLANELAQSPAPTQWDQAQLEPIQPQQSLPVAVDNATTPEQFESDIAQLDPIVRPTEELYDLQVSVAPAETLPPAPGAFSPQLDDATPALAMNYDALDPYAQTALDPVNQDAFDYPVVEDVVTPVVETVAETVVTPQTEPLAEPLEESQTVADAQTQAAATTSGFAFQNTQGYIESPSYFSRAADILGGPYDFSQRIFARATQIIEPEEAYAPSSFARAAGLLDPEPVAQEPAQRQTQNESKVRSIGYLERANRAETSQPVAQAGYVQKNTNAKDAGRPETLRQLDDSRLNTDSDLWQARANETPQEQAARMLEILQARNVSAARVERWSLDNWRASGVIATSDGAAYVEAFGDTPGHATEAFVQKTTTR